MLDYVPGYFKVLRHVRPKLSCPRCAAVVQEPAPSRPIARSMAGAGLLAQVVVAKYADHTPLYRQAGIYRRAGIELDRATLASWVREAAALLQPLSDALGRYVRDADKLHTDDTPVPVLEPGRGKTRTTRLWTYVRDDRPAGSRAPPAVWYRYSPDRKGERPREHLAGYTGILQADAFSGYDALYRDGTVIEAGCWAHARRKFYDIYKLDSSPIAEEALHRIGALYVVEREVRGQTPNVRLSARQQRSAPLLAELKAGSNTRCHWSRRSRGWRRRLDTHWGTGTLSHAIAKTGASRWTTIRQSARSGRWFSAGAIICSQAPTAVAKARR